MNLRSLVIQGVYYRFLIINCVVGDFHVLRMQVDQNCTNWLLEDFSYSILLWMV
jgi:hypothetical protein